MEDGTRVESVPAPVERESERQQLLDFFNRLAGKDVEIDCWELQKILTFALKKGQFFFLFRFIKNLTPFFIFYSSR